MGWFCGVEMLGISQNVIVQFGLCRGSDVAIETPSKAEVEVFTEHFVVSWALWRPKKTSENDV
jgi:hypothetical protein